MSNILDEKLEPLPQAVAKRNPGDVEFHQAAREVSESLRMRVTAEGVRVFLEARIAFGPGKAAMRVASPRPRGDIPGRWRC